MNEPTVAQYGLMAQFKEPQQLIDAAKRTFQEGYRRIDAYSPFPVHGLGAALGFSHTNLPIVTFLCGLAGAICGYGLQYWVHVIDYPINIGGRSLHSGPMFIPVTFELTILFAALGTFFGLWIRNKLPMPYHPVFNVPAFSATSQDGFFLCIEADDPLYDADKTRSFLQGLEPIEVSDVAP